MSDYKEFLKISQKFTELGATEYQYFSEEGKIRWRNGQSEVVAYADCKAIMSFASTGDSYRWGLFPNTPTLDKPDWTKDMVYEITEPETRKVALKAAAEANAEFMFAGNWTTLTIYLACNNIVFENDNIDNESVPWHPVDGDMSKYADLVNSIIDGVK
jgi:hypothetical protein